MKADWPVSVVEFDRVLDIVSGFAQSDASRQAVMELCPLVDRPRIEYMLEAVREIRRIISEGSSVGLSPYEDITGILESVRPEGSVLDPGEILSVGTVLEVIAEVRSRVQARPDLARLCDLSSGLTGFPDLLGVIGRSLDGEGQVVDGASRELRDLRVRMRGLERRITNRLEEISRGPGVAEFLQDEFITKRSGRWVLPVRMDAKGQVAGVVHDVSRSGETAFMEPLEIIGLANELENLAAEEKTEVIRILKGICRGIRASAGEIMDQYRVVVRIDVLNSIALYSERLGMASPVITDSGDMRIEGARHPLLIAMKDKKGVVPLDVSLGGELRVMVITGPNAGGKTIALKTVGLVVMMALSGMPVPAAGARVPLFGGLLVDIGDEQSIESSLSTFSAHVSRMAGILESAGPGALVLIDELGTGTDPLQGAAIGCAVLKALMKRGAMVISTTHLMDVVGFVHKEEGMENASMEFDTETLSPLYRLKTGEPGQSHALEVAGRYGLPDEILSEARAMLGTAEAELQVLLGSLRQKRMEYEEAMAEVKSRMESIGQERDRIEKRLKEAEEEKRRIMEEALSEAAETVKRARREAYDLLEETRKLKKRSSLKKLDQAHDRLIQRLTGLEREKHPPLEVINEGDRVFVRSAGLDATVFDVDLGRGRARVRAGDKELDVSVSDLGPPAGQADAGLSGAKGAAAPGFEPEEAAASRISLVGLRVDDALSRLEPFLNHASLAGLKEVTVIHGIGTGALMKAVRGHLEGHPLVLSYRGADPTEGGEGVTLVELG